MSFVQPQANPGRRSIGIGVAIVFHVALIWALMNGLAHKVMTVISTPIETKIIEEVKPPPPPPKVIEMPPPPKFAPPPPPAFVPPPEVQVQVNPPPQATISATTAEAPVSPPPPIAAAPAVPVPPAPPAPPAPARPMSASVACSNYAAVMGEAAFPRAARRIGLEEGSAVIQFTLGPNGEIKDPRTIQASHPAFAENSLRIVSQFKCAGQGGDVQVKVPFDYKSE